jgi:hypothetical protein
MITGGKLKRETAERQYLRMKAALRYLERVKDTGKRAAA